MSVAKTLGKCALVSAVLIMLFCAVLAAVFMIDDEQIEWHQEYSIVVLQIEEEWESLGNVFGFHGQPGMLDNTTDRTMIQQAMVERVEDSPLRTALYGGGYMRYWHGYLAVLRPMLMFFQIHQIRYLNTFVIMGLLFAVAMLMRQQLGILSSVGFLIAMVCAGIMTVPLSMQFMAAFVVMLIASMLVLVYHPFASQDGFIIFFLSTGMVINYFDFLTAPLITLGIPLLLYMALDIRRGRGTFACGFLSGAQAALSWGVGYALCWAAKWIIASVVLDMDVMNQVSKSASGWTQSEIPDKLSGRMEAIAVNFKDYFTFHGIRAMIVPLAFALMVIMCALAFRASLRGKGTAICMLFVSASPYVWYAVLCHHVYEHNWFTYRAQATTLLGAYLAVIALIDHTALERAVGRWRARLKKE